MSEFKTRLDFSTIVQKTWAYLTIKKLLEEELKTENALLRDDLRLDAVNLAIKVRIRYYSYNMLYVLYVYMKKHDIIQTFFLKKEENPSGYGSINTTLAGATRISVSF